MTAFFSRTSAMPRVALALCLLAAVLGIALVTAATAAGPGVGGDATIYLTTAQNFLRGQGLGWVEAGGSYRLLPYSPPLYPLALSVVGLFAADLTAGARWLNVLLFGATVLLVGWSFFRATRQAWLAGLLAGLLAASPVLLGVHVWAMTEPLFLLTGFAGLLVLLRYHRDPRMRWLALSALLVGLAAATRYAGLAFVGAAGLWLLIFAPCGARRRFGRALAFGLLAVLPLLAWLVIDLSITGTVGSRSGQPAAAYWQRLLSMCPTLEEIYLFWLLPESLAARLPGPVRTALWLAPTLGVVGLALWLRGRSPAAPVLGEQPGSTPRGGPAAQMAVLMALFIAAYLLVLAVVHVFTYPPVTLASRMLAPVHLAALVLLAALSFLALRALGGRAGALPAVIVGLGLLALFGSYAARSALIARQYQRTGIGYNAAEWRNAPILDAVRALPPDVALVSNETTALMYLADRPAYALQEIYQDQPLQVFTVYGEGSDEAQRVFREQGAALVLFSATLRDDFAMYGDRLDERLAALTRGLRPAYQGEDGAIYFYR